MFDKYWTEMSCWILGEILSLATPEIVKMITSIVASDENFEISDSFNVKHQSEYLTNIGEHSKTENKTHHCKAQHYNFMHIL